MWQLFEWLQASASLLWTKNTGDIKENPQVEWITIEKNYVYNRISLKGRVISNILTIFQF